MGIILNQHALRLVHNMMLACLVTNSTVYSLIEPFLMSQEPGY